MGDMEIIGALAKGQTKSTFFFCVYNHSPLEKEAIQDLIDKTDYKDELNGNNIEILAIESVDDMKTDIRLVGLIFNDKSHSQHQSIVLSDYADLSVYLNEMVE